MLKAVVTTALASTVLIVSIVSEVQAQTRRPIRPTRTPSTLQVIPSTPQTPNRVAAPGSDGTSAIETTCTGVQSCNDFIALCVASGGDFEGTAHDPEGRPSAGTCQS
ncbi:MAG: hypothetical protein ACOC3E_01800 [Cyanobacteriota bacterium]